MKPRIRIGSDGSNPRRIGSGHNGGPQMGGQYMRGDANAFFFSWNPALRDQSKDVREAYTRAAARAIDNMHNSGWIAGAVDQALVTTNGPMGLRLRLKPDFGLLKWEKKTADAWAGEVMSRFETWARDKVQVDAAGKQSLAQLADHALRYHFSHGESVSLLPMLEPRQGSPSRLKVKMLPPHKLTQRTSDLGRWCQGVQTDMWGRPVAYEFTLSPRGFDEDIEIRAADYAGRPQVAHVFDGAPDTTRGITPLAPTLLALRQFDQLSNATLTQEMIRAIFAATVKSAAPTEEMLGALRDPEEQGVGSAGLDAFLAAKVGWYDGTKIDLGRGGKIAHLFPGEELEFVTASSAHQSYEAFAKFLLREVARALGMTFETLTLDYTNATYSSVRMAMSEIWPIMVRRRVLITGSFMQTVFEAWLDEEVSTGRIGFPNGGYQAYVASSKAAARAFWRGPPKPQADDLKAAKSLETLKRMGVFSDEMIADEYGVDIEDVYDQRQAEAELRKARGLPDGDTMAPDPVGDGLVTQGDQPPANRKKENA